MTEPEIKRFYANDREAVWSIVEDDQRMWLTDAEMAHLAELIRKAKEAGEI